LAQPACVHGPKDAESAIASCLACGGTDGI
jgi:hypothetical protein